MLSDRESGVFVTIILRRRVSEVVQDSVTKVERWLAKEAICLLR